MKKPLLSIIIPVYNNKKYLPMAVESVVKQEFKDWEIIIVDDGSTDGTSELVDRIVAADNRIRAIHQDNQWIYASFNRGISEAKGEYIYILNSDDKFATNALLTIRNAIEKYKHPDVVWTKVALCKCDMNQRIITKTDVMPLIDKEYFWAGGENKEVWEKLITSDIMINQANAYKREIMQQHEFRNDVYGADHLFNLEFTKCINNFVIIPDEIYLFHQYENNMNTSVGKYYGYEHEMFNEFYTKGMELLEAKNVKTTANVDFLVNRRKSNFSAEIKSNLRFGRATLEQKLNEILSHSLDEIILKVFDSREELDSRILSAIRYKFVEETVSEESEYYFVYRLLESLLRYEKDDEDFEAIRDAVYNKNNPQCIGEIFYKRIMAYQ